MLTTKIVSKRREIINYWQTVESIHRSDDEFEVLAKEIINPKAGKKPGMLLQGTMDNGLTQVIGLFAGAKCFVTNESGSTVAVFKGENL